MTWTDDSAVPVTHHDIVAILQAVRTGAITDAFLALLELLEKTKVTGNCENDKLRQSEAMQNRDWYYSSPSNSLGCGEKENNPDNPAVKSDTSGI
jgi:hypothetical protein